jgi:diguanylate cyclase (GGDEF)-like protein
MKSFEIDLDGLLTVAAGVIDAGGVLLQANAGFLRLLPASCPRPIGAKVAEFFIQPSFATLAAAGDSHDRESYRGLMTIGDYAGKTRILRGRVRRTATGIRVLAEYDVVEMEKLNDAILDLNRESLIAQHTLTRANVTMKEREVQIVEASLTDVLTGVGNRRKLNQALATEVARVGRIGGSLSAIMADVDHFKLVNDVYGHGAGDKVLARVGALFNSKTRTTDIVARFGGEEFVVLMPHTSLALAVLKAEQLRSALAAEVIEPLLKPVTSSFGVA